jgi:hypothetical protein
MTTAPTRAESQERTRARIVDVATTLFLHDGFRVTSLERIGELGIAVIDELHTREERRLSRLLATAGDPQAQLDALAAWADETIGNRAWTQLEIEVAAASAFDERYRAAAAARYARLRAGAAEIVHDAFGDALDIDTDLLATAIVGLSLGIGVQRAADRRIRGSALSDFLRALVLTSVPVAS